MLIEKRFLARKLRQEDGLSLKEIATRLSCAKSSVSIWVKTVALTKEQLDRLEASNQTHRRKAQLLGAQKNQAQAEKLRQAAFQEGLKRAERDADFRTICCLYWGEGDKKRNSFSLSNCDPQLINYVAKWLVNEGFKKRIIVSASYCAPSYKESEVRDHWAKNLTWLDRENISHIYLRKSPASSLSKQAALNKQPYGTANIAVHDTTLASLIAGGIEQLKRSPGVALNS